jgi:hypothetical protein
VQPEFCYMHGWGKNRQKRCKYMWMCDLAPSLLVSPADAGAPGNPDQETEMTTKTFRFPLMLALASALAASPALAQKGGHGHSGGKRQERVERRDDDRARSTRGDNGSHRGWCQGKGNPHNTVANCGYSASRNGTLTRRGTYDRNGTYDRQGTYGRSGTYSAATYQQAHSAYHTQHDRQCRALSSQHPTDLQWLLRVRSQCRSEHEAWHDRYDPSRR